MTTYIPCNNHGFFICSNFQFTVFAYHSKNHSQNLFLLYSQQLFITFSHSPCLGAIQNNWPDDDSIYKNLAFCLGMRILIFIIHNSSDYIETGIQNSIRYSPEVLQNTILVYSVIFPVVSLMLLFTPYTKITYEVLNTFALTCAFAVASTHS